MSVDQLREQPLFGDQYEHVTEQHPSIEDRRLIYETIRHMIGKVVSDLIDNTRRNVEAENIASIDDVRVAGRPLAVLSEDVYEQHLALKKFLSRHLYRHERKLEMEREAQAIVRELFDFYAEDAGRMPPEFAAMAAGQDASGQARVVADYIAGMTDRYAIAEHDRLLC